MNILWLLAQATNPASGTAAQAATPVAAPAQNAPPSFLQWLYVWGEPAVTDARFFGGFITWAKVLGLFCLLGWIASWIVRDLSDPSWARYWKRRLATFILAIGLGLLAFFLQTMEASGQIRLRSFGGMSLPTLIGIVAVIAGVIFVESRLWSAIGRSGTKGEHVLLLAIHAMLVLGLGISFMLPESVRAGLVGLALPGWQTGIIEGAKIGATYMGLAVLVWVALSTLRQLTQLRWSRVYTIAWHTIVESTRRMGAPWIVIALFIVIMAFTGWFLQPANDRAAELSKLYSGALMLYSAVLVTIMITILAPMSIPNDIRQQTIYTVVSKPMHRLELIWGRLLGFMVLATVLLLIFGGISMRYIRYVADNRIAQARAAATRAAEQNRPDFARSFNEQVDQLETRLSARVPVKGSLIFFDSTGKARLKGIDVGTELEARSHIEGATPSKAVWRFGVVRDPIDQRKVLDRRVPVSQLIRPETIEWYADKAFTAADRIEILKQRQTQPNLGAQESAKLASEIQTVEAQQKNDEATLRQLEQKDRDLRIRIRQAQQAGRADEAQRLRLESDQLHSPPIPMQMTFNVYRTTKGEIGEPVLASMVVTNPRPGSTPYRSLFPIREYYTTKQSIPARLLAGCQGFLNVEIRCETINQYIGMAESDLYILSRQGSFEVNYLKGLLGIWTQSLVLASVGLFLGTFLSWPVALVSTIFFWLVGNIAMGTLQALALRANLGGGPFESLIRLLGHDNQMAELAPTLAVLIAKTFDQALEPFLSRLVFLVPNLTLLDVSNTVAEGFAVGNDVLFGNLLLGLGYAIPFTIAAYYILKSREVAA